jgi:teichuronic acid biosynthesis glycosyltransferase TuaG
MITSKNVKQYDHNKKENSQPTFSIILPTYNAEETIFETLTSVVNQTLKNIEILIYDDASADNTKNIIDSIKDNRIKVIYSDKNVGVGLSRDTLLKQSVGRYIAFIDSDDTWHPSKLQLQLETMVSNNANLCTCNYVIEKEGHTRLKPIKVPNGITFHKMHQRNWIPMSTAVIESTMVNVKSMPDMRIRQDYAYWMELFANNTNLSHTNVNQELCKYRRRKKRLSQSPFKNVKYNYLVFRQILCYTRYQSLYYLFLNVINKIFRNG